jgi:TPR repeat protein
MSVDAFVSYATPDRAITMALVEDLEARGLQCWVAPRDVQGGSKYAEVILKALAESQVFLLVFSENSNKSEHVQREVERALHASKTIVPVRIADILPSGAMDYYLATLHWIDAFGAAQEGSFDMVAGAMAGVLGRELIELDEAVGADAVPTLAGAGANAGGGETFSVAPSAAIPAQATPSGQDADLKSLPAKSGGGRGAIIAAAVLALLAVGGFIAWKAGDWNGDGGTAEHSIVSGANDEGKGEPAKSGQAADAGNAADGSSDKKSTTIADVKDPDTTTNSGGVAVAAAGTGVDPEMAAGAVTKVNTGESDGSPPDGGTGPENATGKADPGAANSNVNLAGQSTDLVVAGGGQPAGKKSDDVDGGTKMSVEPMPPDPVVEAMTAAQKAWQSGERKVARESWLGLLQSPAGKDLDAERLGEDGVRLLSEMVVAAADDAEGKGDNAVAAGAFVGLEEWQDLVDFSKKLGLDDLAAERERFQIGWQVAQAESLWMSGARDEAAKSLTDIASLGDPILDRMKRDGDFVGRRLAVLLDEVTKTAAEGGLGTTQALTDQWQPSLQLAADHGEITATGVLATMAWKSGDRGRTAELLKQYEIPTRGAESLDPGVASLLAEAVSKAQAEMVATAAGKGEGGESSLLRVAWEPAFNIAYRYDLPGALEVLADVTHRRDPGEAASLYRRLYNRATEGGSLRKRIAFCLQMLARYDLGEEAKYYRGELQDACELTLDAMDQPSTGGELIDEIPEIRDAANAGVPAAQYIMGDLAANGKGVEKDDAAAFAFYRQAADGGFARAKYAVGECLRDGRGTEKDIDEAVRIWRSMEDDEVAEVPQALFNLAQLLPGGAEQTALYADARKHYAAKVEAGRVALYGGVLGYMLVDGLGGAAEPKRGFELLRAAADQGSSYAAFRAGFILTSELEQFADIRKAAGISLDVEAGTELMKRAARDGYPSAVLWCEQSGVDISK